MFAHETHEIHEKINSDKNFEQFSKIALFSFLSCVSWANLSINKNEQAGANRLLVKSVGYESA